MTALISRTSTSGAAGDGVAHVGEEQVLALSDALKTVDGTSACASHACPDLEDGIQAAFTAVSSAQSHVHDGLPTTAHVFSQLGLLVNAKLATLQSIDPSSIQSLSQSMSNIVEAVSSALDAEAGETVSGAVTGITTYIHALQQMLTDAKSAPMSVYAMQSFSAPFAKESQGAEPRSHHPMDALLCMFATTLPFGHKAP